MSARYSLDPPVRVSAAEAARDTVPPAVGPFTRGVPGRPLDLGRAPTPRLDEMTGPEIVAMLTERTTRQMDDALTAQFVYGDGPDGEQRVRSFVRDRLRRRLDGEAMADPLSELMVRDPAAFGPSGRPEPRRRTGKTN